MLVSTSSKIKKCLKPDNEAPKALAHLDRSFKIRVDVTLALQQPVKGSCQDPLDFYGFVGPVSSVHCQLVGVFLKLLHAALGHTHIYTCVERSRGRSLDR